MQPFQSLKINSKLSQQRNKSALELLFLQKNPKKPRKSQAYLYGEDVDENLSENLLFDDGTKSGDYMESDDDDADDESTHGDNGHSDDTSDVGEYDDDYMDDAKDAEDMFDNNQSDKVTNAIEDDNTEKIKKTKSK